MINRLINISKKRSFFLFGARSTGKTLLLNQLFNKKTSLFIDLLSPEFYRLSPEGFLEILNSLEHETEWIVIDEVQRKPELLNVVQSKMSNTNLKFALTGSSARKLKRGSGNLLAGRASVYSLHPFVIAELNGVGKNLEKILSWGSLPQVILEEDLTEKKKILRSYVTTYIREEIAEEQILRKLEPFQLFLSVAAQMNGKILNYSKIAKEIGVSTITVQSYFQILEDTFLGFSLPAYHQSIRKRQRTNPKFYIFDIGVTRELQLNNYQELSESTYSYGDCFEQFIFLELLRMQSYLELDWRFSYLRTKDDAEIDLIIERPGKPIALIEIKSAKAVHGSDAKILNSMIDNFSNAEAFILSRDIMKKQFDKVKALHWEEGIDRLLGK